MTNPVFLSIPIKDLTVSLKDFQGRAEAYSTTTYNRIASEVKDGVFNFSALPAIMVWKDIRTGKWVILAGHSRTAAFADLSAGKLPMHPKYTPQDFSKIHAQVFEADNLNDALSQAKKVAQESNLSGAQSNIDFAFNVVRPLRESGISQSKYWEKMEDLFGGNRQAVHKLSFLNPNGSTVAMLRATKDLSDRQQRAIVETIAEYIGLARSRMPQLTDHHENELFTWLTKAFSEEAKAKKEGRKLSDEISSETKFLDHISSRIMRLGWTPDQPLNLDLVGSKSIYQKTYDATKAEKEEQIRQLQKAYNERRQQLINQQLPIEKIEELLDPQEKYIIRLQKDLATYIQSYTAVQEATKNELNLFDQSPAPPSHSAQKITLSKEALKEYENKLKKLQSIFALTISHAPSSSDDSINSGAQKTLKKPKRECTPDSLTFPYCLDTYDEVDFVPLGEYWVNNKPFLYIGSSSIYKNGKHEDTVMIYDLFASKRIDIKANMDHAKVDGRLLRSGTKWPEQFLDTLQQFSFVDKTNAKKHGVKYKSPIYLVKKWNSDFGLFRISSGSFRNIYLPYLQKNTDNNDAPTITSDAREFKSKILQTAYEKKEFDFAIIKTKPEHDFLLAQLDFWLTEFEERAATSASKYSPYKYNGDAYDPHVIREDTGYTDVDMLKQICETAIHIFANHLIKKSADKSEAFKRLCDFYKIQPRIEWRSTKSIQLQQYSTPVPIAYLLTQFCIGAPAFGSKYLEPSAGTGLLTIGTPPDYWVVNEIDKDRLLCLRFLGFKNTSSYDSIQPLPFDYLFDAIITNPPFQEHNAVDFNGYKIKRKEFVMAANALTNIKPTGKAAIIIGGLMKYDKENYISPFYTDGVFFNYLYNHYNVKDVISVKGELYKQMGANWHIRIILIDGIARDKSQWPPKLNEIEHLPADMVGSPAIVENFETLRKRIFAML